jgi:hypothetical protein
MTWLITPGQLDARDADANAYMSAVEAADGQPLELATRLAITDFVVGCKADGIWTAIKASCILAGARTLTGALVPLVGTAPTNNNFVSGDYNRKTGLVGNGSTKYLDSNRINSNQPQNNSHISAWVSTVATSGNNQFPIYVGSFGNTSSVAVLTGSLHFGRNQNNGTLFGRATSDAYQADLGSGTATGFKGITRSSSANFVYRNNSSSATVSNTSQTPGNAPVLVFAIGGSSVTEYINGRLAFYSIGESLDLALLDTRVTTLINALSAAIP